MIVNMVNETTIHWRFEDKDVKTTDHYSLTQWEKLIQYMVRLEVQILLMFY